MEQALTFRQTTLSSGIEVVGQLMAGVESAAVGFLVGAGASYETPEQFGITHFAEEMLFRGTERHDARALSDQLDAFGVSYDASTGIEMLLLNAVLIGERLPQVLPLLVEVLRVPAFPEDQLDKVRSLLLQELRQRNDQPAQRVMDVVRQRFFAGHPASHDVLGTEPTIEGIGRADLQRLWADRCRPGNIVASIAGNFDWEAAVDQLEQLTAGWAPPGSRREIDAPVARRAIEVIHDDKTQEHLGFACRGVAMSDPRYYTAALLSYALGGGSSSRLFREVRENRGLAYSVQTRFDGLEKTGLIRAYVGTSAERAHESVEVVFDELRKLPRTPVAENELQLAKIRLKSQVIMRSESTSSRMMANLRSWWFERRLRTLEDVRDEIERVTRQDIASLVEELDIGGTVAAVAVGPRSEDELFGGVFSRN